MTSVEHELRPGDPASVAQGRDLVASALTSTRVPGSHVCDDAVLAASELVTNAVTAASGRVVLRVVLDEDIACVAVYDDGPGLPVLRPVSLDRPHGRGLPIVDVVAARWGVSPEPPGKWVWAEFPVAVPALPRAASA